MIPKQSETINIQWFYVLKRLQSNRGAFYGEPIKEIRRMVRDWTQCPVGSLPRDLPRVGQGMWVGEPLDREMFDLGMRFTHFFLEEKYNRAMDIYNRIQIRYKTLVWLGATSAPTQKSDLKIVK